MQRETGIEQKKATALEQKVKELSEALRAEGLWKQDEPNWVNVYDTSLEIGEADFFEWLQFIYLPNLLKDEDNKFLSPKKNYIAPQAMKFFAEEVSRGNVLRLLVELDSITE